MANLCVWIKVKQFSQEELLDIQIHREALLKKTQPLSTLLVDQGVLVADLIADTSSSIQNTSEEPNSSCLMVNTAAKESKEIQDAKTRTLTANAAYDLVVNAVIRLQQKGESTRFTKVLGGNSQ